MAKKQGNTIFQEASKLRERHPRMFSTWPQYVQHITAIHQKRQSRGKSVGRKKPAKKKAPMAKRKRHATRAKAHTRRRSHGRVGESGISTNSRRHTDYNRNKVNITVGSINKDKKRARDKIEALIGREEVKRFKAVRKPMKKKIGKKIAALKADYRRLCI
jgi:hypothetical protein